MLQLEHTFSASSGFKIRTQEHESDTKFSTTPIIPIDLYSKNGDPPK